MKNYILAGLQILFLAGIIWFSGSVFVTSLPFVVMQMVSALLIFWALLIRYIHKHPHSRVAHRKDVYFLTEGPYEFMRHPIYTGLLLFALSYVQEVVTLAGSLAFLLFFGVLVLRIRQDERLNDVYFKHRYSEYMKTAKKLIPYVY